MCNTTILDSLARPEQKFVKTVSVGRMKKRLRLLIARIEANCDWCEVRRNQSGLSPKELQAADMGQWEALPANSAAALSPMERYLLAHDAAAAKEVPAPSADAKRRAVARLQEIDEGDDEDASEEDGEMEFASDDDEDEEVQSKGKSKPTKQKPAKRWTAEDVEDEEGLPADTQELLILSDSDDE